MRYAASPVCAVFNRSEHLWQGYSVTAFDARYSPSLVPGPWQTRQSGFCYSENDMTFYLERNFPRPGALFLGLALFLAGAAHAQETAVPPPRPAFKSPSDATSIASTDHVPGRLSAITCL